MPCSVPHYHVLNEKTDLSPGGSEVWFDPRHGSEKVFLNALDEFADKSGHPEIATIPWALWGHSGGGIWADVMSTLHPDRVAVIWMRSGTAAMFRRRPEFPEPRVPAGVYRIPSMCNPGVKEKPNIPWTGPLSTFQEYRAKGAPIGFATDPRTGHECGDCRYLAILFFDACLAIRLPDKGSRDQVLKPVDMSHAWLAPLLGDQAVPAASYEGDPSKAVWLPNETVARAWMEYVRTGSVSDTTPPPTPYDVKVTPREDQGMEITWRADADFESGIRCFLVLRDGQELAKVPQTPIGKFGRPLFQSMTYHDTPTQPLPQMQYVDISAEVDETHTYAVITVNSVGIASEPSQPKALSPQTQPGQVAPRSDGYHFEGTISREVLENYLDRSVTMAYFLVTGKPEGNREYLYREDDIRLIRNIGAKFIGRAIYRWNGESRLNDPNFWTDAKALIDKVHAFDPDVIFQGCLFETISRRVDSVKIPSWVFTEFGLPVEDRTFSYDAMLNKDGKLVNHWGRASVPDVTRLETQLWFYYLAGSYIDLGCEALHLGQVALIGMADQDLKEWSGLVARIRAYAKTHARRKLVLLDAHVPTGGMIVDGVSLLDFNSFPLRIKEIPDKPYEAELQQGHLDSLYKRSKGCVSPSGWSCQSLPYLVEFDNFGRSRTPNVADTKSIFVWGWDEISWFSLQDEQYRNQWLVYAYNWIKETDPNGHLQLPVSRMITCPNDTFSSYRANTRSSSCPIGYSQEEPINKMWSNARKQ